jgi:hypothetical protein
MSTIDRYTLEDSEGNTQLTEFEDYQEARERAQADRMKVICNEYEFSDSYLVDDFTEAEEES